MKKLWIPRLALTGYLIFVCFVLFWPVPVDSQGTTHEIVKHVIEYTQNTESLRWADYNFFEGFTNVLMFLPIGALLTIVAPKLSWWQVTLFAAAFSSVAELIQSLFIKARVASLLDVAHNTLGALWGTLAILVFSRLLGKGKQAGGAE